MKLNTLRIGCAALLVAALTLAGCGFSQLPDPTPGPVVKKGFQAVFPELTDGRSWPATFSRDKTPNIRLFAPEITGRIKSGLVQKGLFSALYKPDDPAADNAQALLLGSIKSFEVEKVSPNTWAVAHMVFNGVMLPAYAVGSLATRGDLDIGGYIFPSNTVGTVFSLNMKWMEKGIVKPVLDRTYQTKVVLGSASERTLYNKTTKLTRQEGLKAVDLMVDAVSRDPYWLFLDDFRTLARAEQIALPPTVKALKDNTAFGAAPPAPALPDPLAAARMAIKVVRPISFTPEEAKGILDPLFPLNRKTSFLNDLRARLAGLKYQSQLPAAEKLTPEQVMKLYNDPALPQNLVKGDLAARAFDLAADVINNPKLNPQGGDVIEALVSRLAGQPRLQQVFLAEADKSVGKSWPLMKKVLARLSTPLVKQYLEKRK